MELLFKVIMQDRQNNLKKKNKPGGITVLDFKIYYEIMIIKSDIDTGYT